MHKDNNSFDRRSFQRIDAQLPIKLGGTGFQINAATKNISGSGIYCMVSRFIPLMTKIMLKMKIPLIENKLRIEKIIDCNAIVIRITPEREIIGRASYEVGLFFSDIQESDKELISMYLRQAFYASNN